MESAAKIRRWIPILDYQPVVRDRPLELSNDQGCRLVHLTQRGHMRPKARSRPLTFTPMQTTEVVRLGFYGEISS